MGNYFSALSGLAVLTLFRRRPGFGQRNQLNLEEMVSSRFKGGDEGQVRDSSENSEDVLRGFKLLTLLSFPPQHWGFKWREQSINAVVITGQATSVLLHYFLESLHQPLR